MYTLKEILQYQKDNDISDIHLITDQPPMARNHRGEIAAFADNQMTTENMQQFIDELCSAEDKEFLEEHGSIDKADFLCDVARFRINIFTEHRGYGMNFRMIPDENWHIDTLDIPSVIKSQVLGRSGLILISGPNNSGKSTILNSFVDYINIAKKVKIITFEDPIEYIHEMKNSVISQHEIAQKHKSRMREDLKSVFRQDANVVCIGEIRDADMMNIALEMAETGYLVMGTIHATDTVQTLERIANMFPSDNREHLYKQLSNQLRSILCQHLVPNIQAKSVPCREILTVSDASKNLVAQGALSDLYRHLETDSGNGNVLFDQSLVQLFKNGEITDSIMYEYCHNRSFVNQIVK